VDQRWIRLWLGWLDEESTEVRLCCYLHYYYYYWCSLQCGQVCWQCRSNNINNFKRLRMNSKQACTGTVRYIHMEYNHMEIKMSSGKSGPNVALLRSLLRLKKEMMRWMDR
jgi:hypothetical protein